MSDRRLYARPFDLRQARIVGNPEPLVDQELDFHAGLTQSALSVSRAGVVVFQSVSDLAFRLTWLDSAGREGSSIPEPRYDQPRISPDGRFVTAVADDSGNGRYFVRVYDLLRGTSTRITDLPTADPKNRQPGLVTAEALCIAHLPEPAGKSMRRQ